MSPSYTEEECLAYQEEFKTFVSKGTPAWEVRNYLRIPSLQPQNRSYDRAWNQIGREIRKMFWEYDIQRLDDIEVQMELATRFETLGVLLAHTKEPRKFTEWFRVRHIDNYYRKMDQRRPKRKSTSGIIVVTDDTVEGDQEQNTADDAEQVEEESAGDIQAEAGTGAPASETENRESQSMDRVNSPTGRARPRDFWNVTMNGTTWYQI
ncbi:hypothetical protein TWF718_009834 [Orbilia javanica]|uniref:Uncharacterized protein n=1 Tax=Orbilia javanica TaxID=47235 RepID=A0AAN8RLQ1_9PEZI